MDPMTKAWQKKDMTGEKYGLLTVLTETNARSKSGSVIWNCQCECGKIVKVSRSALLRGQCSCGCKKIKDFRARTIERCSFGGADFIRKIMSGTPQKNNKLGIRGIFKKKKKYVACMEYQGTKKRKSFFSLKEAIGYRRQLEKEFRSQFVSDLIFKEK